MNKLFENEGAQIPVPIIDMFFSNFKDFFEQKFGTKDNDRVVVSFQYIVDVFEQIKIIYELYNNKPLDKDLIEFIDCISDAVNFTELQLKIEK